MRDTKLKPRRKTHRDLVLAHLQRRGHITPVEALSVYKITRLAARIEELRMAGYSINTDIRRDDAGARYARYTLARFV